MFISQRATQWLWFSVYFSANFSKITCKYRCLSEDKLLPLHQKNNAIWQSRKTLLRIFKNCEEIRPYVKSRGAQGCISAPSERNTMGVGKGSVTPGSTRTHGHVSVASLKVLAGSGTSTMPGYNSGSQVYWPKRQIA